MATQLKQLLQSVNTSPSTKHDELDMVLTIREKQAAIDHAIESRKKHLANQMASAGLNEGTILAKLAAIDWEKEIDREEILRISNSNKHAQLYHEQKREEERVIRLNRQRELKERWTAKEFYRLMSYTSLMSYGKKLIVNDDTKPLITQLCLFLSEDERFEGDLRKGLLIRGVAGLGKTHTVRCVKENKLKPISIYSMIDISDQVRTEGDFIAKGNVIYIDDVGSEEDKVVNHYGTKINWFKNFIESYYLNHPNSFNRLIISTNNSFAEIQEFYGFRVRSRMREMFNILDITGKDLRR